MHSMPKYLSPWSPGILFGVVLALLGGVLYTHRGDQAYFAQTVITLSDSIDRERALIYALREREAVLSTQKDAVANNLAAERARNEAMHTEVQTLAGSVALIQKVTAIDGELLKKYSKVYFLNENYHPHALVPITEEFATNPEKDLVVHAQVAPYLTALMSAARAQGFELEVASAYRSFNEQASLKSAYTVRYGSGANTFSADQGYSEHQLGTTVDFSTKELAGALGGFDETPSFSWLQENAHLFGFTLSYPKGNAYYVYEPWHWRFVGVELATKLHQEGKSFYDLDQRVLDTYKVSLFD